MADDWQKGDLALCVNARPCSCCGDGFPLAPGSVWTVERAWDYRGTLALDLAGVPAAPFHTRGIAATRFRKINPLTDEERDETWRDLLEPVRA